MGNSRRRKTRSGTCRREKRRAGKTKRTTGNCHRAEPIRRWYHQDYVGGSAVLRAFHHQEVALPSDRFRRPQQVRPRGVGRIEFMGRPISKFETSCHWWRRVLLLGAVVTMTAEPPGIARASDPLSGAAILQQ